MEWYTQNVEGMSMKNTREKVLQAVATLQSATVQQLADHVKVNPITIRHHLNNLEAENLLSRSEVRHGVGRPHMVYHLTEQGAKRFPVSFRKLAVNIIDAVKILYGSQASQDVLKLVGSQMAHAYKERMPTGSADGMMEEFSRLMAKEGFQIEWERQGKNVTVQNSNCPYHQLNDSHPEICQVDYALFSTLLDRDLEFSKREIGGDSRCIFQFEVEND